MSGWWRHNRWWLAGLPVAAAAMVAASAYNVRDYWYVSGLHHEIASAAQGDFASVTESYDDAVGPTERSYRVRLAGLRQTDAYPLDLDGPRPLADGQQAVVVDLDWGADPDQVLRGCRVAVLDEDGRRYEIVGSGQVDVCTPDESGGPELPLTPDSPRGEVPEGEDRPDTWSTAPVFLLPEGVDVTTVLVWWQLPDHVSLSVS